MIGTNQQAGAAYSRHARVLKIAPVTRAVRAVLAISATTLALAGSGAAMAGTCSPSGANSILCTGTFTDTISFPDADLTLVVGGGVPTSVTPAAGNTGIEASWPGNVTLVNSADITTQDADGIHSYADSGSAQLTNQGHIQTHAYGDAIGIYAYSASGDVTVNNEGTIDVLSDYGLADGIFASGVHVDVANSGTINATGYSWAAGIEAQGSDLTTVSNDGAITATSVGAYSHAFGVYATGGAGGISVTNTGSIAALGSYATGIDATAGGDIAITNSGDILAGGGSSYYATGIHAANNYPGANIDVTSSGNINAFSYYGSTGIEALATGTGGTASVNNSGNVYATTVYARYVTSTGVVASGDGGAQIDNTGLIVAAGGGSSYGAEALAFNGQAGVTNSGDISATSSPSGYAYGILAASQNGSASVENAGSVYAGGNYAYGVLATAGVGGVSINNDSAGSVYAYSGTNFAIGVAGIAAQGDVSITSAGDIQAVAYGTAVGILGRARQGDVAASNSGDISVATLGTGFGIFTRADNGVAAANNSGTIQAYSAYGDALGIFSRGAKADVSNSGSLHADAYAYAFGIQAAGSELAIVNNSGTISATSTGAYSRAFGVDATGGAVGVSVTNSGDISATSSPSGYAYGILAASQNGSASVENSGSVYAGGNYAYGVLATAGAGDVSISNGSAGSVYAYSGTNFAIGVAGMSTQGDVAINSAGDIQTVAYSTAVGILGRARQGDASVSNSGDISVATPGTGFGIFTRADMGVASATNSGTIQAYSAYGDALGIFSRGATADVSNSGSVQADGFYHAFGIQAVGSDLAVLNNSGAITAYSRQGTAVGIYGFAGTGDVSITNTGTVTADQVIVPNGIAQGIIAFGGDTDITNSGSIEAVSLTLAEGIYSYAKSTGTVHNTGTISARSTDISGSVAGAVGAELYSRGDLTLVNSGSISAQGAKHATGVSAVAYGSVLVDNSGDIFASGANYAIAIVLDSRTGSTLKNSGNVFTNSMLEGRIAVLGGDGDQAVLNYGNIHGALYLQDGDDLLLNGNGGVWTVENHSTDFGAGDDTIHNAAGGTIVLDNAAIALGSSTSVGNAFLNDGVIRVRGDSLIDMGTGLETATLVPSLNPLPLINNGVIDFVDGAPDDILTIQGDLGGHGAINLDVSALNHASDLLYVDGSTVSGTAQTVNVAYNGRLSTAQATPVPFAYVTGNSSAGAFVGGGIIGFNNPGDFLDVKVDVTSLIDASNATPDVFSVGVQALGLNDNGVLAASIASGAQSLVNTQIGTWRQRMGVLPPDDRIGVSPWVRVFGDNGDIRPGHVANNFGQGGNFDLRQSNSGVEIGLDTRPAEHLHAGLLLSKSDGRQSLNKPGSGTDDFGASTFGLFGTWVGDNGFYLDASYRWTSFDARLRSQGNYRKANGQVGSFNVETGFNAWTLPGNVTVQPQAQYTRSEVTDVHPLQGQLADFQTHSAVSSRGRLGVAFTKVIDRSGLVWMPYGSVNAVREFDGENGFTINNDFAGATSTRGTSALVELGLGVRKDNFSVTGGVNWADGGALQSFVGGQLVVRYGW